MGTSIAFGLGLLALSIFLVWHHKASWDCTQHEAIGDDEQSTRERDYRRRQYRRRTHASTIIGLIGAAIAAHPWIATPRAAVLYLTGLIVAVVWILVLGMLDLFSSYRYFSHLRRHHQAERTSLQAALRDEIQRRRLQSSDAENTS